MGSFRLLFAAFSIILLPSIGLADKATLLREFNSFTLSNQKFYALAKSYEKILRLLDKKEYKATQYYNGKINLKQVVAERRKVDELISKIRSETEKAYRQFIANKFQNTKLKNINTRRKIFLKKAKVDIIACFNHETGAFLYSKHPKELNDKNMMDRVFLGSQIKYETRKLIYEGLLLTVTQRLPHYHLIQARIEEYQSLLLLTDLMRMRLQPEFNHIEYGKIRSQALSLLNNVEESIRKGDKVVQKMSNLQNANENERTYYKKIYGQKLLINLRVVIDIYERELETERRTLKSLQRLISALNPSKEKDNSLKVYGETLHYMSVIDFSKKMLSSKRRSVINSLK